MECRRCRFIEHFKARAIHPQHARSARPPSSGAAWSSTLIAENELNDMDTKALHSIIKAEYSRWLGIAESIARHRNMSGWGGDALNDVLANVLREGRTFRGEMGDQLSSYVVGAVVKQVLALRHRRFTYAGIENQFFSLAAPEQVADQEADDVWNARREVEAKMRDDSLEFEHSPIGADDLPFTPNACYLTRNRIFHDACGKAAPRLQVQYVVLACDTKTSRRKTRSFTTAAQASLYARAVRAKIAQL